MLHPLYDRARAALRKILPRRLSPNQGITGREAPAPGGTPDSPGFWSLKLRAIGLAESWWSSTGGRTSRRSGVRGGSQAEVTQGPAAFGSTAVSGVDTAVVVHSEEAGRPSDVGRSRDLTVSVDGVVELSAVEQGRSLVEHGHGHSSSGQTTVIGQK